jgi:hypothetical protein
MVETRNDRRNTKKRKTTDEGISRDQKKKENKFQE